MVTVTAHGVYRCQYRRSTAEKGIEQMFEYETATARYLADGYRHQYRDGERFITLTADGIRVHRDAVIVTADGDTVHAVHAVLVAVDAIGALDVFQTLTDADAVGYDVADAIADIYRDAVDGFEIVENVDGSAHAVPAVTARRVTDTATVTVRHADGTVSTVRQTSADVEAVVLAGHRRLLTAVADGVLSDYVDDVDADTVGELPKFPTA